MALDGEAIKQDFIFVLEDPNPQTPVLDLPDSTTRDCCSDFFLLALADTGSIDELKNDKAGFLFFFSTAISSATLKLQKATNGVFADIDDLDDSTYGTFFAFGFFVNDAGEQFIAYQLEWKKVLTLKGAGTYRVKADGIVSFGGINTQLSTEYCLSQYTAERANKTVRIEYFLSGQLGIADDKKIKDLGTLNFFNGIRLSGFFGFPTSTYETDHIQFANGQRVFVEDEQEPEFTLKLAPDTASFIHELMRTDVMQADRIEITDYNANNPQAFIKKAVIKNSEYAPNWNKLQNKTASVEVKFIQEFNNLKKLRC